MAGPNKRWGWADWTALSISLAALYVFSYGPALGLDALVGAPDWLGYVLSVVNAPMEVVEYLPMPLRVAYSRYNVWWIVLADG